MIPIFFIERGGLGGVCALVALVVGCWGCSGEENGPFPWAGKGMVAQSGAGGMPGGSPGTSAGASTTSTSGGALGKSGAASGGTAAGGRGGAANVGSGGAANSGLPAYATWYSALDDANSPILGVMLPPVLPLTNVTVRQIAHVSLGGNRLRIKLSNRYGAAPLTLVKVRIASSLTKGSIDASTDTAVTFQGATSVTIERGKDVWSDDILLAVDSRGDLAVSAFAPGSADIETEHRFAQRTSYVTPGDSTSTPDVTPTAQTITAGYWLTEIDVLRSSPVDVVVAFGDSITDGNGSTADANLRYPDQLSRLALANPLMPELSVVNAGIGGNRWLHDGLGAKASGRFAVDALGVAGVSDVVMFMGINDIGFSVFSASEDASSADIIAAITSATSAAKAARLKVFLGTLLPFAGSLYYTADGETKRGAVNTWIRGNTIADGLVDFDELLRDPTDATKYAAAYDSGDHLHPNDAGYAVMAKAIDLTKLR